MWGIQQKILPGGKETQVLPGSGRQEQIFWLVTVITENNKTQSKQ